MQDICCPCCIVHTLPKIPHITFFSLLSVLASYLFLPPVIGRAAVQWYKTNVSVALFKLINGSFRAMPVGCDAGCYIRKYSPPPLDIPESRFRELFRVKVLTYGHWHSQQGCSLLPRLLALWTLDNCLCVIVLNGVMYTYTHYMTFAISWW